MRSNNLKMSVASAGIIAAFAATAAVAAPAPLLSFNFNEGPGYTTPSSGALSAQNTGTASGLTGGGVVIPADAQFLNGGATGVELHGAAGTGVTGASGDRGLNLSQPTGQGANPGGNGPYTARVTRPQIQGLTSFTLSGFFKADEVIGGSARLFSFSNDVGPAFYVSATANGVLGFNVDAGGTSSPAAYTEVGQYVYFAITYDGSKSIDNVKFYKGTTGANPTFSTVATQTVDVGAVDNFTGTSPYFLYLGNNNSGIRQFDGYLDNVEIYGSATDGTGALSAADVQGIYAAATTAPEPATLAAIVGSGLVALRRRRR